MIDQRQRTSGPIPKGEEELTNTIKHLNRLKLPPMRRNKSKMHRISLISIMSGSISKKQMNTVVKTMVSNVPLRRTRRAATVKMLHGRGLREPLRPFHEHRPIIIGQVIVEPEVNGVDDAAGGVGHG